MNLPSNFKQVNIWTKYMKQWITTHWTPANEDKWYLKNKKQTRGSYDYPSSSPGKIQHRGGNLGRAQWEPELRKWTWGSGKSTAATVYRAQYQGVERRTLRKLPTSVLQNVAEINLRRRIKWRDIYRDWEDSIYIFKMCILSKSILCNPNQASNSVLCLCV